MNQVTPAATAAHLPVRELPRLAHIRRVAAAQGFGRNAERFRADFRGEPAVCVPQVFWELSSRRVLTMEHSAGRRIGAEHPADAAERRRLAQTHRGHAADAEGEDQALDVETGAARKIEEARRVPVRWHEQGLGKPERRGEQTGPEHGLTVYGKGEIERRPGREEGGRPGEPHVLFIDHVVKISTRLPAVQRRKERI